MERRQDRGKIGERGERGERDRKGEASKRGTFNSTFSGLRSLCTTLLSCKYTTAVRI
jgi:hypothetical protein